MVGAIVAATGLLACRRQAPETLVTFFDGAHGLSVSRPAGWKVEPAERGGIWCRRLLAPPATAQDPSPISVTVLAGAAKASLDDFARAYLSEANLTAGRATEWQGVKGLAWSFTSADARTRHRLQLVSVEGQVVGLDVQGDPSSLDRNQGLVDRIWSSFRLERPDRYPVHAWPQFQASLGVPESWKQTRQFSGRGTMLVHFASPALAFDGRQTIHAALSVTLEPAPAAGLHDYYAATRRKLGDNYLVTNHQAFRGGLVDIMRAETPVAVSLIKRYYFVDGANACSLSYEARDDVFAAGVEWADYIASTLHLGSTAAVERTSPPR